MIESEYHERPEAPETHKVQTNTLLRPKRTKGATARHRAACACDRCVRQILEVEIEKYEQYAQNNDARAQAERGWRADHFSEVAAMHRRSAARYRAQLAELPTV